MGILKQELARIDEDYVTTLSTTKPRRCRYAASMLFSERTRTNLYSCPKFEAVAQKASGQLDSKAKCLTKWLNTHVRPAKKMGPRAVILFTEYRATQNWLKEILAQQGLTGGERTLTMLCAWTSGSGRGQSRFPVAPRSARAILLATDAAAEA